MEAAAGRDRIREGSEARAEFKRPVSVSGQRNYRRRTPSSSSRSQSPVSSSGYRRGGHKRDRSLSPTSNHGNAIGNVSDMKKGKQAERPERSKRGDVSSLDGRDIVDHDYHGRYAKEKSGRYYGSQGEDGANQSPERGYQHTVSDKSRGNKFKEKDRDLDGERVQDRGRRDENEKDRDRYRERGREKDCYKGRDEYKGRERGRDREEYRDRERERHRDWNEREHSRHRDERRERDRHRDTNDYKEKSNIHDNRESLKARNEGSEYRCDEARKGTLPGDGTIARCSLQGIDSGNETKIKKEGVADYVKTSKAEERERKENLDHMETKLDDTSPKDTKWGPESHCSNIIKGSMGSQNSEAASDVASAKLAAMKAAQLVNQNLGMSGLMSTDQKKKLLWGSKKAAEQVSTVSAVGNNHWETVQFADRERQEKFNKLMGVKGEKAIEVKTGTDVATFAEDRQKELQIDLEKQFTAGLRRRDGRTVGLGL